jgi:hypothetical protein
MRSATPSGAPDSAHLRAPIREPSLLVHLRYPCVRLDWTHHEVEHRQERQFAIWNKWNANCKRNSVPDFLRTSGSGRIAGQLARSLLVLVG